MISRLFGAYVPTDPSHASRLAIAGASALGPPVASRFDDGPVALVWAGHRAPNVAGEGPIRVVMDGAVYDRRSLPSCPSDAALVAELYRRHGFEGALRRLNGDFAIALHDASAGVLWLGRDRFGVRPLYYVADDAHVVFASRPRALLALPHVPPTPDPRYVAVMAASHYRYFDNDIEGSAYAAIRQVPASHALRVAPAGRTLTRWWSLEGDEDLDRPESELASEYRDLLGDAVAIRMARASHPAFTLSGGMDSATVLALAARMSGSAQAAFSTVYDDPTYDESVEIASMLGSAVARWTPVRVDSPDVLRLVEEMIALHDEPVATATWLSHYLLCREVARAGHGSLFGGLGGDELNAGEYEHFVYFFADLRAAGMHDLLEGEIAAWARYHDHVIWRKTADVARREMARLTDSDAPGRCRVDRRRLTRYLRALRPGLFDLDGWQPAMDEPFASYLKNRTYQDTYRETIPCCLRAQDRHAARFGLPHVMPFYDHRVFEFMFHVASRAKIRDGVAKHLLRESMRGILPEDTRTRVKKTGWNAPAHRWFSGAGREPLLDIVRSRAFRERGIYDVAVVEDLIREHDAIVRDGRPVEDHMMFLWQMLNLELWLRSLDRIDRARQGSPAGASPPGGLSAAPWAVIRS